MSIPTQTLYAIFEIFVPYSTKSSKSTSALHKAIVKVFSDRNLNIKNKFFNAFDRTNTMFSNTGGCQRYMRFKSQFSTYISCRSHCFALVFVYLTQKYEVSGELWKKFEFSTTIKSVLEEIQQVQGNLKTLKILKASAIWWLSHKNSNKRVIEILEEIVDSLDAIYEKSKGPEIKGVRDALLCYDDFVQPVSCQFFANK